MEGSLPHRHFLFQTLLQNQIQEFQPHDILLAAHIGMDSCLPQSPKQMYWGDLVRYQLGQIILLPSHPQNECDTVPFYQLSPALHLRHCHSFSFSQSSLESTGAFVSASQQAILQQSFLSLSIFHRPTLFMVRQYP